MSWNITEREFETVRSLPPEERYEYLVKHVADEGHLWSLKGDDGWVLGADDRGRQLHPVWPHRRYADSAARDVWADARAAPIDVHEWLDVWTPGMVAAQRLVAVFPVDQERDVAIDPGDFATDLMEELSKLE